MSGLTKYEKSCETLQNSKDNNIWTPTINRLTKEWTLIQKDIQNLNKNGIFIKVEDDLSCFNLMIFKKDNSCPYKYTPICFQILPCRDIKNNTIYPFAPPIVKYISFSDRIHPNLKTTGDVCISVLSYSYVGRSGKDVGWNPMMGISTIANILSSILDENSINREPGFERISKTDEYSKLYDKGAEFVCMKESLKVYREILENKFDYFPVKYFLNELKEFSKDTLQSIIDRCHDKTKEEIITFSYKVSINYEKLQEEASCLLRLF
jgi:ubiquitin-protein ligase